MRDSGGRRRGTSQRHSRDGRSILRCPGPAGGELGKAEQVFSCRDVEPVGGAGQWRDQSSCRNGGHRG